MFPLMLTVVELSRYYPFILIVLCSLTELNERNEKNMRVVVVVEVGLYLKLCSSFSWQEKSSVLD